MRADQTCEIARDLLPSVSEGLTSEKTNRWVMEHLDSCPECREKYDNLRASDPVETDKPSADQMNRDVKFMRKIKKRHWITLAVSITCVCALLFFGNYFLREKKFYVPTRAMTIEQKYEYCSEYTYEVTLPQRYSSAEREEDSLHYYKTDEGIYQIEYSMRYSYHLWDYLFPSEKEKVDLCSIEQSFVYYEFPELDSRNTPTFIVIKGENASDQCILWSNADVVFAAQKIAERFAYSKYTYESENMEELTNVYEIQAFALSDSLINMENIFYDSLTGGLLPAMADGSAYSGENNIYVEHFLYDIIMNMHLSQEDLATLVRSAKILVATSETTASEVPYFEEEDPYEAVKIIKVGLFVNSDAIIPYQETIEAYAGEDFVVCHGNSLPSSITIYAYSESELDGVSFQLYPH